ncbi:MAG: hypothetical protein ABI672_06545 [Vicinamibacteria bacterium]
MAADRASDIVVRLIQFVSSLMVGVTLSLAPWTSLWENHPALATSINLREILLAPWFRGAVTGLGLVNLAACMLDLKYLLFGPPRD